MVGKNQPRITRRRFLVSSALTRGGLITANLVSKSGFSRLKLNGTEISIMESPKPLIYSRVGIAHQLEISGILKG